MAQNLFANITQRGTRSQFLNAMSESPNVWENYVIKVDSDAPDETHVWLGMTPVPREFVSGRSFQGLRDFTYNVANKEYELSFVIDQNSVEDDKHGLINARISEAATVWATYKDALFATLLQDASGTNQGNAYDGNTFYNATRTIGDSGTIDNIDASTSSTATNPTLAEAKVAFKVARMLFWGYKDDQGRAGYAQKAMSEMRIVCASDYEAILTEMNEAVITAGDSNPFYGGKLTSIDILPYLPANHVESFWALTGDPNRKPFLYQERTPVQVEVFSDSASIADNHGLKVLVRQRFRMLYGEPRYSIQQTWT